jgi:glycogen synthase
VATSRFSFSEFCCAFTQGFQVSKETPLFVFMGRLDAQKGVDILFEAVDKVLKEGIQAQFVFMGSGIEELEEVRVTFRR